MKRSFFKKRATACVLTALMVAVSIPLGVHCTQTRAAEQVTALFYEGTNGDGYGIQYDLEQRLGTAANLLTVAQRYLEADDPDLQALSTARENLSQAANIRDKYDANVQLSDAAATMISRLKNEALSETDSQYVTQFETDLAAAQDRIARSSYNQEAQAYNNSLDDFPVSWLRGIAGVEELELFL